MEIKNTPTTIEVPEVLPVLPVRNTVLFPNAAVPLIVGRQKSVTAVKRAQLKGDIVLVVAQKDGGVEDPTPEDLHRMGVVCLITKINEIEKDNYQLIVNGLLRFVVTEYTEVDGCITAKGIQAIEVTSTDTSRLESLTGEIKAVGRSILKLSGMPGHEGLIKILKQLKDASQIADLCCTFLPLSVTDKQELLEMVDVEKRVEKLLNLMLSEKSRLEVQNEIQGKMAEKLTKDQRDQILREQMRTISEELGEDRNLANELGLKIEESGMPPEVMKVAKEELNRLNQIQKASPEYQVIRTYLDWMVNVPWKKTSGVENSDIDLKKAREVLDADHYGLEKVKTRVLQFLAVNKLKKDMKGPILCLAGPPGVGKTSLAKSIATALGRNYVRMSLGGMRDEAEIRGHRRTYIGAMPGRLIQSMKRAGVKDPLILLDEVDKIGMDFRGDPASALLEVLDPEQNHTFTDHYLDVPYDLSSVFFVTTANMIENIPVALRDRLEIIEMSSYTKTEKVHIAESHLVPKVLVEHGIKPEQVTVDAEVIGKIIDGYTREAGVRQLTRELASLARYAATEIVKEEAKLPVVIKAEQLENILGAQKYFADVAMTESKAGVVTGLAWTPVGGDILHIEATQMNGKGNLILTGQLGDVMKESAQIALSLIRSQTQKGGTIAFDKLDFHVHVPAGAIPKDGPSAGTAMFLALASLLQGKGVSPKLALTGEITLRGTVLPVGGIKEKVIAAHRAGVDTILLPERNQSDLRDVPDEVKKQLTFHFVKDISQVLQFAGLEGAVWSGMTVPTAPIVPAAGQPPCH